MSLCNEDLKHHYLSFPFQNISLCNEDSKHHPLHPGHSPKIEIGTTTTPGQLRAPCRLYLITCIAKTPWDCRLHPGTPCAANPPAGFKSYPEAPEMGEVLLLYTTASCALSFTAQAVCSALA
eukprot:1157551-Pelagomonas_calceolata.AAC.6